MFEESSFFVASEPNVVAAPKAGAVLAKIVSDFSGTVAWAWELIVFAAKILFSDVVGVALPTVDGGGEDAALNIGSAVVPSVFDEFGMGVVPKADVAPKRDCCGLAAKMFPWFPLTDVGLPNVKVFGFATPNKV